MHMTILLNNDGYGHDRWLAALERHLPDREVSEFPNITDKNTIEYALVWKHPHGELKTYLNLKAVFSLGSGVDHLDKDNTLPDVPVFRLIDKTMADDMALYTLYWVIHFQRQFGVYRTQQDVSMWTRYPTPVAPDFNVSLLGQGAIGGHIARALARNGFNVSAWSRSQKKLGEVTSYFGKTGLSEMLPQSDVLVCCLPHTKRTQEFINSDLLSRLKQGAFIINISRGAVVNENNLLNALDSGQIAGAALDVFSLEPLPEKSPFWRHPKVYVTPHMSGATNPDSAVQIIAKNIEKLERGEMPQYQYIRDSIT